MDITNYTNSSDSLDLASGFSGPGGGGSDSKWLGRITNVLSLLIFILAVLGNFFALLVMFGNRKPIRSTTNLFLVNLACSDLLRSLFMPFTIVARMQRDWYFKHGEILCKIIPVVQGK
ncbi:unnamed protein product [Didymodactylos carnosus]|uniref:G-protein coupled receptors family 1 profile domain-containing protein n=1 Tax=Didymodactylos carnosus TaxID=1234261 RepID=A0A814K7E0_9BILA|nr:unnamed protein product [Didymodactylos carnosus]CAF1048727.1 unnamed protein product [Didymodactylos carnosus]CAF3629721.1 unnamed protein product [Didymodactylos carnosus]CAF3818422.1 unnamed protein product [Didymodactylos carnosus]